MDSYSGESDFIESLDFLSPPVKRIYSSKQAFGNTFNTDTNNVQLLGGFGNKLVPRTPVTTNLIKANYSESSTSLILKRTSQRQILGQCSIASFASLPEPEIEISQPKADKNTSTCEKPLIKVTVIPKTDQVRAAKLLRKRRYIPKVILSTTSNHENSIQTKNVFLIVAGRRREKIYEIKTTGSAKLTTDHDSYTKNEDIPITQLSDFKHLVNSLNMDRKKKKDKVLPTPGERSDAQENMRCKYLQNCECSASKDTPKKKSRVRIFGRLGISEDDKYVLRYGATVTDDKQVMSDVAQLTRAFSPLITETSDGITEEEPEHLQDSRLQAAHNYDLDIEKSPVTDIIRQESHGTQVNFNLEYSTHAKPRYATVSDKKVQCCGCTNISEHNALKDCQSPLVIISVFPKQSPEDLLESDLNTAANAQSSSPAVATDRFTNSQIIKTEKIQTKSDTRKNFKNPIITRSTSPEKKKSRSKVADKSVKGQTNDKRSPDRQKALRFIKEKIREKDKLKQDTGLRNLPTKLNSTNAAQASKNVFSPTISNAIQVSNKRNQRVRDMSPVKQISINNDPPKIAANGKYVPGIRNNTLSYVSEQVNGPDSLVAFNAIRRDDTDITPQKLIGSPKPLRYKPMKQFRAQDSKATQTPKTTNFLSNHATQASTNDSVIKPDATQIPKKHQNFITSRMQKNQETFVAKPTYAFKSEQTSKPVSKTRADMGTITDHAKTKKALVDNYTKTLTEKMYQRDYIPPKFANSKVTINIDGERECYDVMFNQNEISTDLSIRKTFKDVGSQQCAEPTLGSLLYLPDCAVERGRFLSGSKSPTKRQSILCDNRSDDELPLDTQPSRLTIRDSIEIFHRREDRNSSNIKNTQTSFMNQVAENDTNETEFSAPIKHFTGDDCSIGDPIERDKQIRELLGVDNIKPNSYQGRYYKNNDGSRCIFRNECNKSQGTEINFRFQELGPHSKQPVHLKDTATLCVQCPHEGYTKLKEGESKALRYTGFPEDEKVANFDKYPTGRSKIKGNKLVNNGQTALYQQLILNRNIQVFLQLEEFSKQKPIILSRKQYDKVKKTIQKTTGLKRGSHEKRKSWHSKHESSEMFIGEIRTKKIAGPKSIHGKTKKQHGRISMATAQEPQHEMEPQCNIFFSRACKVYKTEDSKLRRPAYINWRYDFLDQTHNQGDAKVKKQMKDKNNDAQRPIEIQNKNKKRLEIVTEIEVGVGGDRDRVIDPHLTLIEETFDQPNKIVQTPDRIERISRNEEALRKEHEVETYVLFNAEDSKDSKKDAKPAEYDDKRKTLSSVEIRYASVAFMKQVAYSSTDVGALSESSLGHLNSFHTLFRGHRKCKSPNLGTSAYSLYSEDALKYNLENNWRGYKLEPQDSKPKKPFLRRLMSCLVMRSAKNSAMKLPLGVKPDLPSINSSLDSYHISSSLGAMEISSSIYDTSASFYSNHTILPINSKMKRGFFSSVRGFLTNRKS